MSNEIAQYATKLVTGDLNKVASCDMKSSCVHLVQSPISTELFDDLKAMAAMYGGDARCIAGDLLSLAIKEVFASLPAGKFEEIEASRKAYDDKRAQAHMDESFYSAGGS